MATQQQPPSSPKPPPQAPPQTKKPITIKDLLEAKKQSIADAAGKYLDVDRLLKIALLCVMKTPKLGACSAESLLQAVTQCAEWGVYPGTGSRAQANLIPRWSGKLQRNEAIAQLTYQGTLTLARRALGGELVDIEARCVYESDEWECTFGFKPSLTHKPNWQGSRDPKDCLLVYSLAWLKGAPFPHVEVMTRADIEKVRATSQSANEGPWVDWWDEMAKKTVLKRITKQLPTTEDLAGAIEKDDEADGPVVEGTAVTAGMSAPPPANVRPLMRSLPEATLQPTIEIPTGDREKEPAVLEDEPAHDPATGELLDEAEDAMARLRQADIAAKASAAAAAPLPPVTQSQPIIDVSAPDAAEQIQARMRAVAEDPAGTPKALLKAAELGAELASKEQGAAIGRLYGELLKVMKARKA